MNNVLNMPTVKDKESMFSELFDGEKMRQSLEGRSKELKTAGLSCK